MLILEAKTLFKFEKKTCDMIQALIIPNYSSGILFVEGKVKEFKAYLT